MIEVVSRPSGYKLSDTVLDATITDLGGDALVTTAFSHALGSGSVIYVQSNVEAYNGYKYITSLSTTTFKISDNPSFEPIEYIQDADITYQVSVLTHGVVAAHNPVVYGLHSTLFPENTEEEAYVPATVASTSNNNGYTQLNLSGNLSDATALAWIAVNGEHYQIITALSDSIVVINHAYNVSDSFPGPVVKYYNNYCINVDIYCGLPSDHPWASVKPIAKVTTLKFTPDDDGNAKFSISEIVRSYLTTRNKLDLNTLPNNTDFSTSFYIDYYESYDESSGSEITTHTDSPTSDKDNFTGIAINAMMPFKSKNISAMSDYINQDAALAKWLLIQTRLVGIVGKFMDISFINRETGDDLEIYENGVLYLSIDDPGAGVIRVPLDFTTEGEKCYQAFRAAVPATGADSIILSFLRNCGGGTWLTGASPTVTLGTGVSSGPLYIAKTMVAGVDYTFSYDITVTASAGTAITKVTIMALDSDCNIITSDDETTIGNTVSDTITITPPINATRVAIAITNLTIPNTKAYTLTDLTFEGSPGSPAVAITESICIDVVGECDSTFIPTDDMRLLEDGDFRLLE